MTKSVVDRGFEVVSAGTAEGNDRTFVAGIADALHLIDPLEQWELRAVGPQRVTSPLRRLG